MDYKFYQDLKPRELTDNTPSTIYVEINILDNYILMLDSFNIPDNSVDYSETQEVRTNLVQLRELIVNPPAIYIDNIRHGRMFLEKRILLLRLHYFQRILDKFPTRPTDVQSSAPIDLQSIETSIIDSYSCEKYEEFNNIKTEYSKQITFVRYDERWLSYEPQGDSTLSHRKNTILEDVETIRQMVFPNERMMEKVGKAEDDILILSIDLLMNQINNTEREKKHIKLAELGALRYKVMGMELGSTMEGGATEENIISFNKHFEEWQ